jgi:hypothetical protein
MQFMRLSSYGLVTAIVLTFTQFPLRKWFGIVHFKIKSYLFWLVIELSLISLVFVFLYDRSEGDLFKDFLFSLKYTFLGLSIPYLIALLIIYIRKKSIEIKKLSEIKLSEHAELVSLRDENQKVQISLKISDLLFLESTDNYVSVYYVNKGKVRRSLVRNTLKALEEEELPPNIIRCHRSYMINLMNIDYIKKYKRTYQVKLVDYDTLMPVSQKYKALFQEMLK